MSVQFNAIPGNLLVPFFYAEVNSGGSPYVGQAILLLVGQKTSAGSATANVPVGPLQSEAEAIALFGLGSMLVQQYVIARKNAAFQTIWALPLADPAGASATATITITAPGVTGVGMVRVQGRRLPFQVNATDTATNVAATIVSTINAAGLAVTASNASGVVTVTARHVGALGNLIDVTVPRDEPNVLTSTNAVVVAMSGGTGVPVLTTALANCGDREFDWIAGPYADTTSLNAIRDFLSDTVGRWAPVQQLYGHYFTASFGTLSTLVALGNGRNDPHVSIMGSQASPSATWEWASALAGVAAQHLTTPPELSRPLQTLELAGVLPPDDLSLQWDIADRQALYADGIAAYRVDVSNVVRIDRCVTTYQQTAVGVADATFRDVETMAQIMYTVRYFRTAVSNRHARQSLADENPFNVASVATPRSIRNTIVHAYNDLVALGVAEAADDFANFLVVQRNALDANRVDAFIPVDVVNQLRIFAANITAFLQYRSASGAALVG